MANAPHKVTINGKVASMVLADVYDNGADYNIGSAIGIEKLGDTETLPTGTFPVTIGNGLAKGLLARLVIRHKDNATDQVKTSRIICPIDKAPEAVTALVNKTYAGNKVLSVSVPQRRRYT